MTRALMPLLVLLPSIAYAASPFDGTWKTRVDSVKFSGKPDVFEVRQGVYDCTSCVPEIKVNVDGADHKVTGHDYYDSVAVRVVSPSSIEVVEKRAGKPASTVSYSVSPDGGVLTGKFTDYSGAQPFSATFTERRVAPVASGAHGASGSWQADQVTDFAELGRTVKYEMTPDGMRMNWNGQSYDAKFDGKEYPVAADPGKTVVVLKRIGPDTVEETDKRGGKVFDVIRMKVSRDGRTMDIVDNDPVHETRTAYTMEKQP